MASMPFDEYHKEFQSLTRHIQQQQAHHEKDESIQSLLTQCRDLIKQMSIEARSEENGEVKQELLATVRMCKSQLAALEQDYNKQSLLTRDEQSENEQLYHKEKMVQKQQDSLDRARETLADTEVVAGEISTELAHNRDTLERSQGNISTFSSMTEKAASIIKTMSRRRGIKD